MPFHKTQPLTVHPKLRLAIVIVFSLVLLLEIIFALFKIPAGGRTTTPFDMQAVLAVLVLVFARPKLFSIAWRHEFRWAPLVYKFAIGMAVFVLTIKTVYFLGYLTGVIFR